MTPARTMTPAVKGTLMLSSRRAEIGSASTSVLANAMIASFGRASPSENARRPNDERSERRLRPTGRGGKGKSQWPRCTEQSQDVFLTPLQRLAALATRSKARRRGVSTCVGRLLAEKLSARIGFAAAPDTEEDCRNEHRQAACDALLVVERQSERLAEPAADDVGHPCAVKGSRREWAVRRASPVIPLQKDGASRSDLKCAACEQCVAKSTATALPLRPALCSPSPPHIAAIATTATGDVLQKKSVPTHITTT